MQLTEQGRRLRRDVVWNLVPVALLGVVGLGLNYFIGRVWGAAALGAFTLVTSALFIFAVLGAGGLQYAVLRGVAEDPEDRDRVAAVVVGALIPNVALAALATAAFFALRRPVGALVDSAVVAEGMAWAAPGLFCFAINKVLMGVVNGLRRMRAFAVYTSLRYLLIAAGLVLARAWGLPAAQLAVIWTFTEGVLLLVLLAELLGTVRLARGRGWLGWAWRHLDYGLRSVLATLGYELNSKLDVWMLGVALPEGAVGIYSLASALYEGAMQLAIVLQNNFNPVLARHLAVGEPGEVEAMVRRSRRWLVPSLVGCAALGAALYPVVIPWLIGDPAFAEGAAPFAILMIGFGLTSPYLPFASLLLMAGRPGWHTVLVLAAVAVAYVGNAVLIPIAGLSGAAIAMVAGLIASALLLRVLARWLAGVRL